MADEAVKTTEPAPAAADDAPPWAKTLEAALSRLTEALTPKETAHDNGSASSGATAPASGNGTGTPQEAAPQESSGDSSPKRSKHGWWAKRW